MTENIAKMQFTQKQLISGNNAPNKHIHALLVTVTVTCTITDRKPFHRLDQGAPKAREGKRPMLRIVPMFDANSKRGALIFE